MAHISDIKLIRTDTTLDLSQKAEKGMTYSSPNTKYVHLTLMMHIIFWIMKSLGPVACLVWSWTLPCLSLNLKLYLNSGKHSLVTIAEL
ncbi:hypothetical protein DCAR_0625303 [Daucus carota subsp. sativus]|uniref:Uncharacterized protein n=1 Tax=Daucus carota subsp. sativus TaxID=79200 RepID=A0AAF0XD77_DAUCS|nr:hypothetical protein DCAR_0625303 [Daucus carota subsp. sativus]